MCVQLVNYIRNAADDRGRFSNDIQHRQREEHAPVPVVQHHRRITHAHVFHPLGRCGRLPLDLPPARPIDRP